MSRAPYILHTEQDRTRILSLITSLDIQKPWDITVEPHKKRRSSSANALYWRWITIIADVTGNDKDDMHDFFKDKFLEPRIIDVRGEQKEIRSTAKLDTKQMSEYMERVLAFAGSQLGLILPVPEELHLKDRQ